MKILLQLVMTLILAFWPVAVLTSVMLFDAPGSADRLQPILMALVIIFYPMILGITFYFFNFSLWTIPPKTLLIITTVLPILALLLSDYPKLLMNSVKGIPSEGYAVKGEVVYYSGDAIPADSRSFQVIQKDFNFFARDKDHVYYLGRVINEAQPESFQILENGYVKDKAHVFFPKDRTYVLVEGARAETFVVKDDDATDGVNHYERGQKK
jgi:hypothetical protein